MRILVIKFSSIGDIILTTSPLTTLRRQFPEAQIDFFTLNEYSSILEGHPHLNQILVLDRSAGYLELKKVGRHLNDLKYDLVLDLHNSIRSRIIRRRIINTEKRTLIKPRWNRFKLFQFHLNHFPDQFSQLQLLHTPLKDMLDSSYNYPETSLFLSKTEKQVAFSQLKLLNVAKEYVVIVPGAAWRQKTWSIKGYSKIVDSLEEKNISTVMLGTSSDLICKQLAQLNSKIINLQGKTNVRESLAIISQANLVIGGDTGFVHGAEALKIPVIMIMGPTTIETGGGVNLSISKNIEVNDLWCRPCSQNGSKRCYRNEQYCMSTISSSQVFSAVQKVFSK